MANEWRLNKDIWAQISEKLDFYTTCQLALSNSYFYKLANLDFKGICLNNNLYRLPGETWSDAVFDSHNRLWNDSLLANPSSVMIAYGNNTDRFCFIRGEYVIVTSCDFSNKFVKFFRVGFRVYKVHIIEEGKYLVVLSSILEGLSKVFNTDSGDEVAEEDLIKMTFNAQILVCKSGVVKNVLSQKSVKLKTLFYDAEVDIAAPYVLYKNGDEQNCIQNFNTGEEYVMDTYDQCFSVKILREPQCILIQYYRRNLMEIHDIESKTIIFKENLIDSWKVLNDFMILNEKIGRLLVFDTRTRSWAYSKSLKLNTWAKQTLRSPWEEVKNFAYFDTIRSFDHGQVPIEFDDDYDSDEDSDFNPGEQIQQEQAVEDDDIDYQYYGDGVGNEEVTEEDVEILYFNVLSNHRVYNKRIKAKERRPHPYVSLYRMLCTEAERRNVSDRLKVEHMYQLLNNWVLQSHFLASETIDNVSF